MLYSMRGCPSLTIPIPQFRRSWRRKFETTLAMPDTRSRNNRHTTQASRASKSLEGQNQQHERAREQRPCTCVVSCRCRCRPASTTLSYHFTSLQVHWSLACITRRSSGSLQATSVWQGAHLAHAQHLCTTRVQIRQRIKPHRRRIATTALWR